MLFFACFKKTHNYTIPNKLAPQCKPHKFIASHNQYILNLPDPSHPHVTAFLLDIDQEQVGLWLHFDTSKVIYLLRKHNITS